ncbi:hypothetical protein OB13_04570 [Pontibacter sp. HJ8]
MNSTAFAILLLASSLCSCESEGDIEPRDVPAETRQALLTIFPNSSYIEWEKKGSEYEAEFKVDTVAYAALFNGSGKLLKYKHAIREAELSGEVTTTIRQKFSGYKLDEPEKLLKDGSTFYQVELETTTKEEKLVFLTNGQRAPLSYWD